jgi:cysteine synthase
MAKYSILDAIGNTPLVELINLNGQPGIRILGKYEARNPGGSVKDRPAYYMIKTGRRKWRAHQR